MSSRTAVAAEPRGYAPINGLRMYYDIVGTGEPLVYIHGALAHSGLNAFPELAKRHTVISMDLQGHGRTADIADRPLSIQQYAEDVVALLKYLGVEQADFLGDSYGGSTAVMIAVRHPEMVRRVAACAATYTSPDKGHNLEMLRYDEPPTATSRAFEFQRKSYESVAPDPGYWRTFWQKLTEVRWTGFAREELAKIEAPVLIILGDRDFVLVEHGLEALRLIPNAELAVIPDAGHFSLMSQRERVVPIVQHFLEKPARRPPVATAGMGYHPGETR